MISAAQNTRFLRTGGLAAFLLFCACACAKAPDTGIDAKGGELQLPAIIPPAEVADPSERPSYEVGIASAAADRNQAKAKCVDLPKIERETCEAAAESAFATAEADLEDLRGNQQ